ncbi:peptidoglycan DD-metalloendopeptidase family protein [Lysobacter soli]|uniref:peptidoglycan DD-metalloendopeptidase family protein n=1 Tax=Lysobacter soli TaxID=453783 RepID=UPI00367CCC36
MRRSAILVMSSGAFLCACTPATVKVWPSSGSTMSSNDAYVVQAGDSLYGIASRNGVRVVDLAQANGIAEPFVIHPGDRLRLPSATYSNAPAVHAPSVQAVRTEPLPESGPVTKPVSKSTAPNSVNAAKPNASTATTSKVVAASAVTTKPTSAAATSWRWPASGTVVNAPARSDATPYALDIAGAAGSPVRAAAAGKVLYSGEGSPGYEQLIVIEHAGGWVSSYAHNRKRLVGEGQSVAAGAQIAEMGHVGAGRDMVHFELRRGGQLVDPRTVLPPR